jgi:hypothetical protein
VKEETMIYEELIIEAPFKFSQILELEMKQSLNEHGFVFLKAVLAEEEKIDTIHYLNEKQILKIKKSNRIIFSGMLAKITMKRLANMVEVQLVLASHSIQLDFKEKSRSFQNVKATYEDVFKKIVKEYGGDLIDYISENKTLQVPRIQYKETDWAYIKRLASYVGGKIYPYVQGDKVQVYVGIHIGETYKEDSYEYKIKKQIKEYLLFERNFKKGEEIDFVTYEVESLEDYELGDKVVYEQITFAIVKKVSVLKQGRLVHTYTLQKAKSIRQGETYNPQIKGASLDGTILAIEKDKIKVHLNIDEAQKEEEAYWYKFATPYTTEGQTGWYVMPEVGSSVSLYSPSSDEASAYTIQVNRQDGEENPKTQDPTIKYFGTAYQKEMKLAPTHITFSAPEDQIYIKLENKGIQVASSENIKLYSEKGIKSESETVEITAKERIILRTDQTNIIMDNVVHIKG